MSLTDDARNATQLAPAVTRSILHEVATDPDALTLAVGGILMNTRLSGLGKALVTYFAMRQLGHYTLVLAAKADRLAQVISEMPSEES